MANPAVYVNEYDLSQLGFTVTSVTGPGRSPQIQWATSAVPTRAGLLLLDARPTIATRPIVIQGMLRQATMAAFWAALDELKQRLSAGALEMRLVDQATRFFYARLNDQGHDPVPPQFLNPYAQIQLTLEALDPYGYDVNPTLVAFGAAAARLPLGTAPVAPLLRLMGAATNPTLTYRSVRGDALQTIALTVTLAATDYLDIDCAAKTVTKVASGVASNALSAIAGSDFLVVTAEHGDYPNAAWPTLEISAGSGLAIYRKGWF